MRRSKSFDKDHSAATVRAGPERSVFRFHFRRRDRQVTSHVGEESTASVDGDFAEPIREESEMADANESRRQNVQEEAAKKFLDPKRHHALFIVVDRIAPAEAHLSIRQADQSVIGDSDAVRVITQVLKDVFRAAEWPFGIDDPLLAATLAEKRGKRPWRGQVLQLARETATPRPAKAASSASRNLPRNALAMPLTGRKKS